MPIHDDRLQRLITLKKRRLQYLREHQAIKGIDTPPHITIEIEDLEEELEVLQSQQASTWPHEFPQGSPLKAPHLDRDKAPDEASALHYLEADWGEAPDVELFFGREAELVQLEAWLVDSRCRVVMILGIGGMGKTALAVTLAGRLKEQFDYLCWRSLQNAPPVEDILADYIKIMSDQQHISLPAHIDAQISLLIKYLQSKRCLLILDNLETILQGGERADLYQEGYQGYGRLIERIAQTNHQSCLLLTSREKPRHFRQLEGKQGQVRLLQLYGLSQVDCQTLLRHWGIMADETAETKLIQRFGGNPLALKLASRSIDEWHTGDISEFLNASGTILDDIQPLLEQHLERVPELGLVTLYWLAIERDTITRAELARDIVYWLAMEPEGVTAADMRSHLLHHISEREFKEALEILYHHALIEKSGSHFTLQPVIAEYLTEKIVDQACEEIRTGKLRLLQTHALLKSLAKEYVRQSQIRRIVKPIIERLLSRPTVDRAAIEIWLTQIVAQVQAKVAPAEAQSGSIQRVPGYVGGNVLNLLLQLGSEMRGRNFSGLVLWQAYLRGAQLPEVDFTGSDLSRSTFTETFSRVFAVAYSPDGDLLAAGTEDGEVVVWHIGDGRVSHMLTAHQTRVRSVAFSPDGHYLASGSLDQTVRIWELRSGECLWVLNHESHMVWSVAFSPDSRYLASAHQDKVIRVWSLDTGDCIQTLSGHEREVRTVIFGSDGQTLISSSSDRTLRVWDLRSGACLKTFKGHTDAVWSAACFDGQTVVSGSIGMDQTVRVWDVDASECRHVLHGHTDWVLGVAVSSDGRTAASSSSDCTVRLWDIMTGQCLHVLHGHRSIVWSVAFSPDGTTLSSGGEDQSVRVWDVSTGRCLTLFEGYSNLAWSVAFSPDGRKLASGHSDGAVRLWDATTGVCHYTFYGHTKGVRSVAFSPDGRTLVSGSEDRTVRLWDVATTQLVRSLQGHIDWVTAVAFSPDGSIVASGSSDKSIRFWPIDPSKSDNPAGTILNLDTNLIQSIALGPSGESFAIGGGNGIVQVWQARTLAHTVSDHNGWVMSVAYRNDGRMIASGSNDRTVHLLDVITGQKHILPHASPVLAVAFSPNGTILASGSADHIIRLWQTAQLDSEQLPQLLTGHIGAIRSLAFSPDGTILTSSSDDQTIQLWDVRSGTGRQTLQCERPYEGMNITGVAGVTEAQKRALKSLGAVEVEDNPLPGES
jgi:WD40 repeat protein